MSAMPARSTHGPNCSCSRCVGFLAGNAAAVRHGAYASPLKLSKRQAEIADAVRPLLPVYSPADEPVLMLLALAFARIELASAALDRLDEMMQGRELGAYVVENAARFDRLREDLRGWIGTARRLSHDLGLSPTSRAKLGLHIALGQRALTVVDLHAAAEAEEGAS